jgi:hypothetical protein
MSDDVLAIALDDPAAPDVSELLSRHLALAREVTPSGHVHALEVAALKEPHVDFYSARWWPAEGSCGAKATRWLER